MEVLPFTILIDINGSFCLSLNGERRILKYLEKWGGGEKFK